MVGQVTSSMGKVTLQKNPSQSHTQNHTHSIEVLSIVTSKLRTIPVERKREKTKRKLEIPALVQTITTILAQTKDGTSRISIAYVKILITQSIFPNWLKQRGSSAKLLAQNNQLFFLTPSPIRDNKW